MELLEFTKLVQTVNFHYQKIENIPQWNQERKYYEKILKLSWTSPSHRKIWIKIKENKLTKNF
jgi:hypothetical protein